MWEMAGLWVHFQCGGHRVCCCGKQRNAVCCNQYKPVVHICRACFAAAMQEALCFAARQAATCFAANQVVLQSDIDVCLFGGCNVESFLNKVMFRSVVVMGWAVVHGMYCRSVRMFLWLAVVVEDGDEGMDVVLEVEVAC